MSDQPKKRRWFQFHLSTAIVLMFVAGGLVWANVQTREILLDSGGRVRRYECGWPKAWVTWDIHYAPDRVTVTGPVQRRLVGVGIAIDLAAAIGIIGGTGLVIELGLLRLNRARPPA